MLCCYDDCLCFVRREIVPPQCIYSELLLIISNGHHATLHILLLIRCCIVFALRCCIRVPNTDFIDFQRVVNEAIFFLILRNLSEITIVGPPGKTRLTFYFNGCFVRSILMHVTLALGFVSANKCSSSLASLIQ